MKALSADDDSRIPSGSASVESGACNYVLGIPIFLHLLIVFFFTTNFLPTFSAAEGVVRGRSYNIKLDDQVLLRFSPKNSDSTYYFSDMVKHDN